jgi:HPt (histidine-containing phosphotransfer) domain-containing protein
MLLTTILKVIRDVTTATFTDTGNEEKKSTDFNGKINLHNLYHITGGDEQFTKQMLTTFLETTGKGLQEMHEAVNSGQWEAVADLAHKMLPPSRHIGASDLCNLLRKVEDSIRNKSDKEAVDILTKESFTEFAIIRDILNGQIAKIN